MKDGYGILPMPKYDEAVAAVLELMNCCSYRDLVPAYYEVAMKTKCLADSASARMFDIIVNDVKVDFGELYSLTISGGFYSMEGIYAGKMRNMIRLDVENLASNRAQYENSYKENLKGILELFDGLE